MRKRRRRLTRRFLKRLLIEMLDPRRMFAGFELASAMSTDSPGSEDIRDVVATQDAVFSVVQVQGTASIESANGPFNYTSMNFGTSTDLLMIKSNYGGQVQWIQPLASSSFDLAGGIEVTPYGQVVVGWSHHVDGMGSQAFVTRFDTVDGRLLDQIEFGGEKNDYVRDIKAAANWDTHVVVSFDGPSTFVAGEFSAENSGLGFDSAIVEFDESLTPTGLLHIGGGNDQEVFAIMIDSSDYIYAVGHDASSSAATVHKFDRQSSELRYVKQFANGLGGQKCWSIDSDGINAFVALSFYGAIDLNSDGQVDLDGTLDSAIIKLDPGGNPTVAAILRGDGYQHINTLDATSDGRLVVGGSTDGDLTMQFGSESIFVPRLGTETEGFIGSIDVVNRTIDGVELLGSGIDDVQAITNGIVYGINFSSAIDVDPDPINQLIFSPMLRDAAIVHWNIQTDLSVVSAKANGGQIDIDYFVSGKEATSPVILAVYQTVNGVTSELFRRTLAQADLTKGNHRATIEIGTGAGQIRLPGAGLAQANSELNLTIRIDADGVLSERVESNNKGFISGWYHLPTSPVYVLGTALDDQVRLINASNNRIQLELNGQIALFNAADVTDFSIFTFDGNDSIAAVATKKRMRAWSGPGNDTIRGGLASDFVDGGLGSDTYQYFGTHLGDDVRLTPAVGRGLFVTRAATTQPNVTLESDRWAIDANDKILMNLGNGDDSLFIASELAWLVGTVDGGFGTDSYVGPNSTRLKRNRFE